MPTRRDRLRLGVLLLCLAVVGVVGGLTWLGSHIDWFITPTIYKVQGANRQTFAEMHKNSANKRALLTFLQSHHIEYDDIRVAEKSEMAVVDRFPKGTTSVVEIWIQDLTMKAPVGKLSLLDLRFFYNTSGKKLGERSRRDTRDKEQRIRS